MTDQIKIRVEFIARLREVFAAEHRELEMPNGATAKDLQRHLPLEESGPITWDCVRPIRDNKVCTWSLPLNDGDTILLLPPITGG